MSIGLLIIRSVMGVLLIGHGTQKLFGWFGGGGPGGTGRMLADLGYPRSRKMALLAGTAEAGGGALLALGFATPVAAAAIIGVMVNAIFSAHAGNGPWNQNGGWEYPLVLASASFGLAWTGPGVYSIDNVIGWNPHDAIAGLSAMALGVLTAIVVLSTRRPALEAQQAEEERAPARRAA